MFTSDRSTRSAPPSQVVSSWLYSRVLRYFQPHLRALDIVETEMISRTATPTVELSLRSSFGRRCHCLAIQASKVGTRRACSSLRSRSMTGPTFWDCQWPSSASWTRCVVCSIGAARCLTRDCAAIIRTCCWAARMMPAASLSSAARLAGPASIAAAMALACEPVGLLK